MIFYQFPTFTKGGRDVELNFDVKILRFGFILFSCHPFHTGRILTVTHHTSSSKGIGLYD